MIMKKIFAFFIVAASLLAISTSCKKDEVREYDFINVVNINVRDVERSVLIQEYINKDSYFSGKHTYTGTLEEALSQAVPEFDTHVKALDDNYISSQLLMDETVKISLWSMDPGQPWRTYIFYRDRYSIEEE